MLLLHVLLLAVVPLIAAAPSHTTATARGHGKVSGAAGPQKCTAGVATPFWGQANSTDNFKGSYAAGVQVSLLCFTTGTPYAHNKYWDLTADGNYIPESSFPTSCAYQLPTCA